MEHIVTTHAHFSEKSHYDIVHRIVDKYIVVPHRHMAVPYRGLRRKSVFDVDIDILCPIVGKYLIPLRRYRIVPQRCFCPKRAYDVDIDILSPATQDCAPGALLSQLVRG
jgi:hypothetical protein